MLVNSPEMQVRNSSTVDPADVASCKFFLKCDEDISNVASGANTSITDSSSSGLIFTMEMGSDVDTGAPSNALYLTANKAPSTGAMPDLTTKDILLIHASQKNAFETFECFMGTYAADTISWRDDGTTTNARIGANTAVSTVTDDFAFDDLADTGPNDAALDDTSYCVAFAADRSAGVQALRYDYDTPANNSTMTNQAFTNVLVAHNVTLANVLRVKGDFFGMAIFAFDNGLPSDWKEGAIWMAQQWIKGNKVIWPNAITWV